MDKDTTHYFNRKLHSLLGVMPLGAFILEHIFTNGFMLGGQNSYDRQVSLLLSLPRPVLIGLELLFIAFPLLFHGLYGVVIIAGARFNTKNYAYPRNRFYFLQRASSMYLLAFIIYHVWTTRFTGHFMYPTTGPLAGGGTGTVGTANALVQSHSSIYYFMLHKLSGNWLEAAIYLLGVMSATFHFSNGLFTFCIAWGITVGKRAQTVAQWLTGGLGFALFALGTATVMHLVLTPDPFPG